MALRHPLVYPTVKQKQLIQHHRRLLLLDRGGHMSLEGEQVGADSRIADVYRTVAGEAVCEFDDSTVRAFGSGLAP